MTDSTDIQESMLEAEAPPPADPAEGSYASDAEDDGNVDSAPEDAPVEDAEEAIEAEDADDTDDVDEDASDEGADDEDTLPASDLDEVACVEALLFASDAPLTAAKLASAAGIKGQAGVKQAIGELNERYDQAGCAFRIESLAAGFQMLTRPEYNDILGRMFQVKSESKLSQAALETLAIVAYRQPILRADVEAIRGVAAGEVLRGLMEKQLVKIVGRAEVIGRPMLYGTTRRFLEIFGLKDLNDLPRVEELRRAVEQPQAQDKGADSPATDTADQDGEQPFSTPADDAAVAEAAAEETAPETPTVADERTPDAETDG